MKSLSMKRNAMRFILLLCISIETVAVYVNSDQTCLGVTRVCVKGRCTYQCNTVDYCVNRVYCVAKQFIVCKGMASFNIVTGSLSPPTCSWCGGCSSGYSFAGCPGNKLYDDHTCTQCSIGKYSSGGLQTTCDPCPVNTYSSSPGQSLCQACAVGFYTSTIGSTGCIQCTRDDVINNILGCTCPSGYYDAGNETVDCLPCTYSEYEIYSTCGCPPGQYDTGNGCSFCPAGTFSPVFGTISTCTKCMAGKYNQYTGSNSSSDCLDCLAGKYNKYTGGSSSSDCLDCPAGKYNQYTGSSSSSDCLDCSAGKYNQYTGSISSSDCLDCLAGKYNKYTGGSSSSDCLNCPAGKYNQYTGSSSSSDCLDCSAGKYSLMGSQTCSSCLIGTYGDSVGAPACTPCLAGTYSDLQEATACLQCQSNTYSLEGWSQCSACSADYCIAGTYFSGCGGASAGSCLACPPGSFSSNYATECIPCPVYTFANSYGQSQCYICDPYLQCPGSFFYGCGGANGGYCVPQCPLNTYSPPDSMICLPCNLNCEPGFFLQNCGDSFAGNCTACTN